MVKPFRFTQTEDVSTRRVTVKPSRHDILERDGFDVTVWLNGHRTITWFHLDKGRAQAQAKRLRAIPIPRGAQLGLFAGRWVPTTSCDELYGNDVD